MAPMYVAGSTEASNRCATVPVPGPVPKPEVETPAYPANCGSMPAAIAAYRPPFEEPTAQTGTPYACARYARARMASATTRYDCGHRSCRNRR